MKGRASWLIYGSIALVWAGFFGWRMYSTRTSGAQTQQQRFLQPAVPTADFPRVATPAERIAACTSISNQLAAFKKGDYATAVKYQSTGLRKMLGGTTKFRTMIQRYYPQFTQYEHVNYGSALSSKDGTHIILAILLTDKAGTQHGASYRMVRENGTYHIDGVAEDQSNSQPQQGNGPDPQSTDTPVIAA